MSYMMAILNRLVDGRAKEIEKRRVEDEEQARVQAANEGYIYTLDELMQARPTKERQSEFAKVASD